MEEFIKKEIEEDESKEFELIKELTQLAKSIAENYNYNINWNGLLSNSLIVLSLQILNL